MTDVGAGGCDSWGGAGPCRGAPLPGLCPRPGPGCATPQLPGTPAWGCSSTSCLPPTSPASALPGEEKDWGEPGAVRRNSIKKILFCHFPEPQLSPAHGVRWGNSSPCTNSPTVSGGAAI